jgi:hypothetical protein
MPTRPKTSCAICGSEDILIELILKLDTLEPADPFNFAKKRPFCEDCSSNQIIYDESSPVKDLALNNDPQRLIRVIRQQQARNKRLRRKRTALYKEYQRACAKIRKLKHDRTRHRTPA